MDIPFELVFRGPVTSQLDGLSARQQFPRLASSTTPFSRASGDQLPILPRFSEAAARRPQRLPFRVLNSLRYHFDGEIDSSNRMLYSQGLVFWGGLDQPARCKVA